jgi:hypothetical protein
MKGWLLPLVAMLLLACATPAGSSSPTPIVTPAGPPPTVSGIVTAGPVCPAERNPPDPSCAPRRVAGAVIVATEATGQPVGRATSAADGTYLMIVGETGTFVITALPVTGLMGVPASVTVTLAFPSATARVDLVYDTGMR